MRLITPRVPPVPVAEYRALQQSLFDLTVPKCAQVPNRCANLGSGTRDVAIAVHPFQAGRQAVNPE